MKLRPILTIGGSVLLGVLVLIFDIVRKTAPVDIEGLLAVREIMLISSFVLLYLFLEVTDKTRIENSVRKLGLILVATVIVALMTTAITILGDQASFEAKEGTLTPLNYTTVFVSAFVSLSFALLSLLVFRFLRDLILYKRRRGTRRNLIVLVLLMAATALSTLGLDPLDSSVLNSILFGLAAVAMLVNSFRLSWIVYLSKREKVFSLIYAFLLFGVLTYLNVVTKSGVINQILLYQSYPLHEFVAQALLFGNIYAGMAFISTLFHLPTAEAFEKKATEVTSLHTLGRLINRVFDFDELVDSVSTMTLQVCEAEACWLEIIQNQNELSKDFDEQDSTYLHRSEKESYVISVVGMKNISVEEIRNLLPFGEGTLRDAMIAGRKPLVVDDLAVDSRVMTGRKKKRGSMVVVPMLSHTKLVGILYAIKDTENGFFKDDVDVVSAFADQATIAIENSRLIDRSLERERLSREMLLAQEMQKRLLPQSVPKLPMVQIDAISTPAYEVGGDYYDFAMLDGGRSVGIVVGDVSGKGVSAAFYMSEVKGIFQSLSRIHPSPRDFITKANEVLSESIDRRSFISLIYAVVDTSTGILTLARAGHCPMLLVKDDGVQYIRPSGMGLGLCTGESFTSTIEETMIQLNPGDVCVFYTDGLTEARNGEDEFGYERLVSCTQGIRTNDAARIKNVIIEKVKNFTVNQSLHDDLTLVVLKWNGFESRDTQVS